VEIKPNEIFRSEIIRLSRPGGPVGIGGILVTQIGVAVYAIAQFAATLSGGIGQAIFSLPR